MKRCSSVFFFFDDNDATFKDMILSEAKERGYRVTTKQYSSKVRQRLSHRTRVIIAYH